MQVLHICGLSGVGKATLTRRLSDDNEHALRSLFRVKGVARCFGIPDHEVNAWSLFTKHAPPADCYINKWQFCTHHFLEGIRARYPEAEHRAVLLYCDANRQFDRYSQRQTVSNREIAFGVNEITRDWEFLIEPNFRRLSLAVEVWDCTNEYLFLSNHPLNKADTYSARIDQATGVIV